MRGFRPDYHPSDNYGKGGADYRDDGGYRKGIDNDKKEI